jgi:superfamily II RNA helicase
LSQKQGFPLLKKLPKFEELSNDLILDRFLEFVAEKELSLYPAQEEAVLALVEGQNVILNTPTGSGKSLVATALHFHSLSQGKRSIYTCPIKALVNEKFLNLAKEFGPDQVGMVTGDGAVNPDAPILCCTAEILANMALRDGEDALADDIVMDEFHYYSDRERGGAWQIPLLTLKRARFLLMSATLGEMDFFAKNLTELTGRETAIVSGNDRPVPLEFEYRETPLHETIQELIEKGRAPIYLVNFTQANATDEAQNLMSIDFTSKENKKQIAERLHDVRFSSPFGKEIQRYIKHGVGLHHAGLLPKYRVLVEKLAQEGLLKVISGTDTLGVGVNVPIRTVLFTKLCKYDGEKTAILSVRDFHQIAGRAGRKGFDNEGFVVAQAPEHVIENLKMEAKAKADPKKAKKMVKAKPPERGYVPWNADTFKKLIASQPEKLESRFQVTHGMILEVLSRTKEDGCKSLRDLIRSSHELEGNKKKHRSRAFELFRSLVERGIIEILPERTASGAKVRVNVSLQEDFSLNHALSLWLIDTLALLDPESETYALDVLTLVEAILESPDLILRKQLDRVKTLRMREMKEAGMEYEERMEELEKCEYPKPLREFIYDTFNAFSDKHPWVGHENIRPKSIAREMFETFQNFPEYIREYELQRAEGVLLRYLSEVYKALVQTVPEQSKNEDVDSIIEYFGNIVRGVDSSLLEEWERMRDPNFVSLKVSTEDKAEADFARAELRAKNEKALRRKAMNDVFSFLRLLATGEFAETVALLAAWSGTGAAAGGAPSVATDADGEAWTEKRLQDLAQEYGSSGHSSLRTDPGARHAKHTRIDTSSALWRIEQRMVDPEEHNDWELVFTFDSEKAMEGESRLQLLKLGPVE